MKTTFTRDITPNQATSLVEEIINNTTRLVVDDEEIRRSCSCSGMCSCAARYAQSRVTKSGLLYCPDYHSGDNVISFPERDVCRVEMHAGSGVHILAVNVKNGQLVVMHAGARKSFPGNGFDMLPKIWFEELNRIENWLLVGYETSEPEWAAVAGLLKGKVGQGPANAEEADQMAADWALSLLKKKAEAAGRELPPLSRDIAAGKWFNTENGQDYLVRWTGVEYRRASANGVEL